MKFNAHTLELIWDLKCEKSRLRETGNRLTQFYNFNRKSETFLHTTLIDDADFKYYNSNK